MICLFFVCIVYTISIWNKKMFQFLTFGVVSDRKFDLVDTLDRGQN